MYVNDITYIYMIYYIYIIYLLYVHAFFARFDRLMVCFVHVSETAEAFCYTADYVKLSKRRSRARSVEHRPAAQTVFPAARMSLGSKLSDTGYDEKSSVTDLPRQVVLPLFVMPKPKLAPKEVDVFARSFSFLAGTFVLWTRQTRGGRLDTLTKPPVDCAHLLVRCETSSLDVAINSLLEFDTTKTLRESQKISHLSRRASTFGAPPGLRVSADANFNKFTGNVGGARSVDSLWQLVLDSVHAYETSHELGSGVILSRLHFFGICNLMPFSSGSGSTEVIHY